MRKCIFDLKQEYDDKLNSVETNIDIEIDKIQK